MADDTTTYLQELAITLEARLINEHRNRANDFDSGYIAGLGEALKLTIIARDEELS